MKPTYHYMLMTNHMLLQKKLLTDLKETELTAGQPKVLDYLGQHNGSIQKRIAAGCQIDPATLTGLLGRMEEKGLIERRSQDGDRRSLCVYLTEEGWEKQKLVRSTMERLEEEVLTSLGPVQGEALMEGLLGICLRLAEDREALQ